MLLKKLDIVLLKKKHTAKIESTGGEAKTSPEIAAVNIPGTTNPAWAGSWPLPPPMNKMVLE